ncbi:MAG: hypothetical protein ACP5GJ_03375 [Nanopusillaceae archaeon]
MDIISTIFLLASAWLNIFINTLINLKIVWITYPVYIAWFSMEFFVERKGIHFSHAVANSIIFSWVSIDWLRELYEHNQIYSIDKLFITLFFLFISLFTLFSAFKRWRIAKIIGKTEFFAYFQIMLTPFIYDIVEFNYINILSLFVFFPFLYLIVYLLDRYIPEISEEEEKKQYENIDNFAEENLQYSQNYNYSGYNNYYSSNYPNNLYYRR